MRLITIAALAATLAAPQAFAQATTASRMTTPCPMHLTTLALTPAQDSAFIAFRAAHRAEMHAVHEKSGAMHHAGSDSAHAAHHAAGAPAQQGAHHAAPMREAMQASMKRTLESARAVLTPAQLVKFEAAVAAHDAEKKALAAKGAPHECADCCPDHDAMHEKHHGAAAKRDG